MDLLVNNKSTTIMLVLKSGVLQFQMQGNGIERGEKILKRDALSEIARLLSWISLWFSSRSCEGHVQKL